MGNRGCLHDDRGQLTGKHWTRRAWVTCLLVFKGRRRTLMAPGRYTELFFLDEATAFSAGHCPCAECPRADCSRFKTLWLVANAVLLANRPATTANIDQVLHQERGTASGDKWLWEAMLGDLPDSTFVTLDGQDQAYVALDGRLLAWSETGYVRRVTLGPGSVVHVLTPRSITQVFSLGYRPAVHPSGRDVDA
jgi:hypothetical protein